MKMRNAMRIVTITAMSALLTAAMGCASEQKQHPQSLSPAAQPAANTSDHYENVPAQPDAYAPPASQAPAQGSMAPEPAPQPAASGATYTIQKGDTLWKIAEKHYGNGQRWVDILKANPGLNPHKLPAGKVINLP